MFTPVYLPVELPLQEPLWHLQVLVLPLFLVQLLAGWLVECWIISVFFPPLDEAGQAGDRGC